MSITEVDKTRLAKTAKEFRELASSSADWIARSPEDLRQLRSSDRRSALARIPLDEFNLFVEGLKFDKGALTCAYYKPLMSSLTLTEIFDVFEHFGMDREFTLRTLEYSCENRKCEFNFWYLCTIACEVS